MKNILKDCRNKWQFGSKIQGNRGWVKTFASCIFPFHLNYTLKAAVFCWSRSYFVKAQSKVKIKPNMFCCDWTAFQTVTSSLSGSRLRQAPSSFFSFFILHLHLTSSPLTFNIQIQFLRYNGQIKVRVQTKLLCQSSFFTLKFTKLWGIPYKFMNYINRSLLWIYGQRMDGWTEWKKEGRMQWRKERKNCQRE